MKGRVRMSVHYDTVLRGLTTLASSDNPDSFVVFVTDAIKNYYIQFYYDIESATLSGEVVGNDFLAPDSRIAPAQIEWLGSIGWETLESGNFGRQWSGMDSHKLQQVTKETVEIFSRVFGARADAPITVESEVDGIREGSVTIVGDGVVSISYEMPPSVAGNGMSSDTFCATCGAHREGDDTFCSSCGAKFG
jgi:hypothetical protein